LDESRDWGGWRTPIIAVAIVVLGGAAALTLMGTQVSRILSTVGASVDTPAAGGYVVPGEGEGQSGEGGQEQPEGGDAGSAGPGSQPNAPLLDVGRPDLQIIKTGSITIQVPAIDAGLAAATRAIDALGGYASASERSGSGDDAGASATFRIPAGRWDDALIAVRAVGESVLDESTRTDDVTGQVVDLKARIRNLQVSEAAFQSIMDRASAIKDVLAVQDQLTSVRGKIEQLTAEATHLQEQAAMSTLTVALRRRPTPVIKEQEAAFDAGHEAVSATARLVAHLQTLATAGIWFGIVWLPILASLAIVGGIAFVVVRRVRGAGPGEAPPIDAPPIEPSAKAGA
jgi:hypothetical protein